MGLRMYGLGCIGLSQEVVVSLLTPSRRERKGKHMNRQELWLYVICVYIHIFTYMHTCIETQIRALGFVDAELAVSAWQALVARPATTQRLSSVRGC